MVSNGQSAETVCSGFGPSLRDVPAGGFSNLPIWRAMDGCRRNMEK